MREIISLKLQAGDKAGARIWQSLCLRGVVFSLALLLAAPEASKVTEGMTLYASSADKVLAVSRRVAGGNVVDTAMRVKLSGAHADGVS